jgi:glycosyltransferase involved in cell wall biosynthesis
VKLLYGGSGPVRLAGGTLMAIELMRGVRALGHDAVALAETPPEAWWPDELPLIVGDFGSVDIDAYDAVITGAYGVEPALASGARTVVQFVAGYEPDLWPRLRDRFERIYRRPTVKAVIEPHIQRSIERDFGLPSVVVGSPIDLSRFSAGSAPAGARIGPPRVLTVGPEPDTPFAPIPFKGIGELIKIVREARAAGAELELVRLTPFSDSLAGSDQIDELHVGTEPDRVPELYRSCDLYLGASTPAEGLGMPPFEAACAGVPSLIPAIPSFRETPGLERCARFYPPGDRAAAARALRELLADRELREQLGAEGPRAGFERHFDGVAVAERLANAIVAARRS